MNAHRADAPDADDFPCHVDHLELLQEVLAIILQGGPGIRETARG